MRSIVIGLALWSLGVPVCARAQTAMQLRAGGAWNATQRYSAGPVLALGLDLYGFTGGGRLGVRGEGMLVAGRHAYVGILPGEDPATAEPREIDHGYQVTPGLKAGLVFRERPNGAPYRLEAFSGISFTRFPWMATGISRENFGPAGSVGLATVGMDPDWILDIGLTTRLLPDGLSVLATITIGALFDGGG